MHKDVAQEFLFDPRVVQLNHASYGAPTRASWERVNTLRRDLELDPAANLGEHLIGRFEAIEDSLRTFLQLPHGQLAFTLNTTEAHETVARSLLDSRREFTVALADDEYESMRTTWSTASKRRSQQVSVAIMTSRESTLLADVTLQSVVTSSAARLSDPSESTAHWARILDASHAPGHVPLDRWIGRTCQTAIVGSLHKWLPAARPAGFLWLSDDWHVAVRPAIASLRSPDSSPSQLLTWRGTWDPAPHLAIPTAIAQWIEWRDAGLIESAEALANLASESLEAVGLHDWNNKASRAPRMRSFLVPNVGVEDLKNALSAARINAWVGPHQGQTILRLAFNVYNEVSDIERVVDTVRRSVGHR